MNVTNTLWVGTVLQAPTDLRALMIMSRMRTTLIACSIYTHI